MDRLEVSKSVQNLVYLKRMYLVFSHIHVFDENAKRKIIDHLEFLRSSNLLGRFDFIFYHFQIAIGFRAKNEKKSITKFFIL